MPHAKRLSEIEQGQVSALRDAGHSLRQIAKQLKRSVNCISQFFKNGRRCDKFSTGRPRVLTPRDENHIRRLVSNTTISANQVRAEISTTASKSTILRAIHRNDNIVRQQMKKAPMQKPQHKQARVAFARANMNLDWDKVSIFVSTDFFFCSRSYFPMRRSSTMMAQTVSLITGVICAKSQSISLDETLEVDHAWFGRDSAVSDR